MKAIFTFFIFIQAVHGLEVKSPWILLVPPTSKVAAFYAELNNQSIHDLRIRSITSSIAKRVEIHESYIENGQYLMRPLKSLVILKGRKVLLRPKKKHLMLIGLTRPLKELEEVTLTFHLHSGKTVKVKAIVKRPSSQEIR